MAKRSVQTALPLIPPNPTVPNLRKAAADCTACPLFKNATQTVFGEGPAKATIMMAGEVPGNDEDLQGKHGVGPTRRELRHVQQDDGQDRSPLCVTKVQQHCAVQALGEESEQPELPSPENPAGERCFAAELPPVQPSVALLSG